MSDTIEPQTEIGRRIINNPDAPTFYEIKQLAWHMASLWESLAGSAERYETVMLHYQALRIREATIEVLALIKTIAKKPEGSK